MNRRVAEGVRALILPGPDDGTRAPRPERFVVFVNGHNLASSSAMAKAGFTHVVVLFGNTYEVAEAIAGGARTADPTAEVDCVRVAEADLEMVGATDLLVVGGPTTCAAWTSGMTRKMGLTAEEKKDEAEQHEIEPGAEGPGVRDWFGDLPKATKGSKAAAFHTRGDARMAGGAAHGIARRLRRHGVRPDRRAGGVHHRGHRGAAARW